MSDDFGNDFVTISDEDGNDFVLEHVDTLEFEEEFYMALLPTDIDEDHENFGLVILKVINEDGEELLSTIDDEELLDTVYDMFMDRFTEEEE